jgi:hypothetical protein
MSEIWKAIPNYEGIYEVSNLGNVKSLSREIFNYLGSYISEEKIMKQHINQGYKRVNLSKNNKLKNIKVHQLVAMAFLNHIPDGTHKLVVDHINNNPLDNRFENLQIITNRDNASKDKLNYTSKYTGVFWDKERNKWQSKIHINGKTIFLGRFLSEQEAHLKYQEALKSL